MFLLWYRYCAATRCVTCEWTPILCRDRAHAKNVIGILGHAQVRVLR